MEVPTSCDGAATPTAAQQIAKLQAELERCKREKLAMVECHNQVVRDLKGSYADALEWAYSLENIARDHWLQKGHTEEYAVAMDTFLDKIKQIIKKLRTGAASISIDVDFILQHDDGRYITSDHDDVLMPYWKELANALVHWSVYHSRQQTLQVSFAYIETPDAVLDVLRPAIKRSRIRSVCFTNDGTPKPWKFPEFIGDIIQTNHKVVAVSFVGVMLIRNEDWEVVCNAIRTRNAAQSSIMTFFELSRCFRNGINNEMLKEILTSSTAGAEKMTTVLEGNDMSSQEAPIIAEYLSTNPPLDLLSLNGNRFDNADATILANSLANNTNLRGLFVDRNNIGEEGKLTLLSAIFDVSSLASCAASNHTCQVLGLQRDISALNRDYEASSNKWNKIFAMLALSSADLFMNASLLIGTPASMAPILLEMAHCQNEEDKAGISDVYLELTDTKRCQKHDVWKQLGKKTKPINCMYELMRSWVVPLIYA
ncbi:hypothetical protein THAOC_37142 [Thalassiosira oceanica]|uniref:Uncharacterized protein n=1 Tax=Thalassiosira oceanica TaxID=159749 RepID=K0QZ51_THAOC|nr:hypothetical protein THAOC_37142 [Thalassiosira oceanica]|eukprot:EJK44325.1 hypothetical protein THAOC_37142 [Thalassiosira oceanica]